MGERTSYTNGTFSWVENSTTDQDGAKTFYASLFGWQYDDSPVSEDVVYTMAKLGDDYVGAIAPQMEDERKMGVPPHWNNYVTVDDVDATTARASELGGQVLAGPFDVMEAGRMSVLMDPTGAVILLWQANQHIGAGLVNFPGALCWNELATRDTDAAIRFYSELLGWTFDDSQSSGPMRYWMINNGANLNGGMREIGDELPPEVPAHWLPYFAVESVDGIAGKATAAGGRVLAPKMSAGDWGSIAVLSDPVGASFAIFEGRLDP